MIDKSLGFLVFFFSFLVKRRVFSSFLSPVHCSAVVNLQGSSVLNILSCEYQHSLCLIT